MGEIRIERNPPRERLEELGVFGWGQWSHPAAVFPWTYDEAETCYFLDGDVVVTPENGKPVTVGKGDLVTFPGGMSCTWEIKEAVRKHYTFG